MINLNYLRPQLQDRVRIRRAVQRRFVAHRHAIAAIKEESRPPESSIAKGASDISLFTTALTKLSCNAPTDSTIVFVQHRNEEFFLPQLLG